MSYSFSNTMLILKSVAFFGKPCSVASFLVKVGAFLSFLYNLL